MPRKRPAARATTPRIQQKRPGARRRKQGRLHPPDATPTWSQIVAWVALSDAAKSDWPRVTDDEREAIGHELERVLGRRRATPQCLEAVITAANYYRAGLILIDGKPNTAQQRATLRRWRDHTYTLLEFLQSLDDASRWAFARESGFKGPMLGYLFTPAWYTWENLCRIRTPKEIIDWTYTLQDMLNECAWRLHLVCQHFPDGARMGAPQKKSLKAYVQQMADIWESRLRQPAKITHNPSNKNFKVTDKTYTEFWKFLQAGLGPIDPTRCNEHSFVRFAQNVLRARRRRRTAPDYT